MSCHSLPGSLSVKLPDSKDFWSGIMLIAIGGGALVIGRDYPFGTALRMGAGFFPLVLGAGLVLFGVFFAVRGLRRMTASRATGRCARSSSCRSPSWCSAC